MTVPLPIATGRSVLSGVERIDVAIIALGYRRVSKAEQADDGRISLKTQDEDIVAEISRVRGARLLTTYTDLESGTRDDRAQYQAMLEHVRALVARGTRVVVVVAALDRFGRRLAERVRAWNELKTLGVEIRSSREGGLMGELQYNILGSVAQEEVRRLSERITRSNRGYREAGWLRPGGCRWGYRWRPSSEIELASGSPSIVLDEDDETAPYVRELFERAANGESINSLAKWTARLPAEARGKGQNGAPRVLSYAGVRQILRAPVYVARHGTYGDDVLDRPAGKWVQLVTDEQWTAIHGTDRLHKTRAGGDGRYPLTGLLWCSQCRQYRMGGRANKPRMRGKYLRPLRREYTCTGHVYGSTCQMVVPAAMIEAQVTDLLRRIFDELALPGTLDRARQLARQEAQAAERRVSGTRLGALRTDLTKAETRLTESWMDSADGKLNATAFATIQARLTARIDEVKAQIAELETAMPVREVRVRTATVEMVLAAAPAWAEALEMLPEESGVRAAIGSAAALLIDRIWAVREGRGRYRLEVRYTEAGMEVLKLFAAGARAEWVERYDSAKALYQLSTLPARAS